MKEPLDRAVEDDHLDVARRVSIAVMTSFSCGIVSGPKMLSGG